MADLTVDSNTSLGNFLRKNNIQQWRIPILVARQGVKVYRGGNSVPLKDDTTPIRSGDLVRLADPMPKACQDALRDEAKKNSRDYAFVPGATRFDVTMGKLIEARPLTIRVNDPLIKDLASFVRALQKSAVITNPIRDILVASHANPEGLLFISIDFLSPKLITYEDLEAAVKSKTIVLDDALFLPRPSDASGVSIPARFLFRGCRIGSQRAFMIKLKEAAFGNKIQVVAPLHFHIVAGFSVPPGFVEYMAYNFMTTAPDKLKTKKAVVAAFAKAGLNLIDGKSVPGKLWTAWIPDNPNVPGEKEYPNVAVIPINKRRGPVPRRFRYRIRTLLDQEGSFALLKDTGKDADRRMALKQELTQLARYKDTHPFPEFVRYGYRTIDDFMDGWHWNFRYDKTSKTMYYNGTRHEYTLLQPIADIKTNELVLNFYPTSTKGSVIELLNANDVSFFATI